MTGDRGPETAVKDLDRRRVTGDRRSLKTWTGDRGPETGGGPLEGMTKGLQLCEKSMPEVPNVGQTIFRHN